MVKFFDGGLRQSFKLGVGLLLAATLPFSAQAQKKYDTGASDTEIRIGNTSPYSGPASSYGVIGKVEAAYFKMINEKGGVNGRKINFMTVDDGYNPAITVEQTRKLVEQDEVLLMFASLGTPTNAAVHRYLNAKKVPQLFPNSGASKWNDPIAFPWTVAFAPSNKVEMRIYAQHLLRTKPDAKVAVLYQNDDLGKEFLRGFKDGLGTKAASMIVGEASYEAADPTVDSQIVQLRASGADTLIHMSQVRFAALALRKVYEIGWRPVQYLAQAAGSVETTFRPIGMEKAAGVISMAYYKDSGDPTIVQDADYKTYLSFMKQYMPAENPANAANVTGYVFAQGLVVVLKACGDQLTRENVIKQATSLKGVPIDMMLPGISLNTSATDFGAIQQMRLRRFNGKDWEYLGEVVSAQ